MEDRSPLWAQRLVRIFNPGVPWYVAIPCSVAAMVAIVLLIRDPDGNMGLALAVLIPSAIVLYETELVRWWWYTSTIGYGWSRQPHHAESTERS